MTAKILFVDDAPDFHPRHFPPIRHIGRSRAGDAGGVATFAMAPAA